MDISTAPRVARQTTANRYLGMCRGLKSRRKSGSEEGVDIALLLFIIMEWAGNRQTLSGAARSLRGPGTDGLDDGAGSVWASSNLANSRRCAARSVCFSGL